MNNERVAVIIPAFNEAKNVGNVLKVLLRSKDVHEIILVDDGSSDETSAVGRALGVKVITLPTNIGKARAMLRGLSETEAEIIVFCDADLVGLSPEHIALLVAPVARQEAVMSVGIRDRWWNLPAIMAKVFPVTFAIAGERAIRPFVLKNIKEKFLVNMTDTVVMNYYCKINRLSVAFIHLKGLNIVVKEKKYGLFKGLFARFVMVIEFMKIRPMLSLRKKDFLR